MTQKAASPAQVELIKACILFVQEKGEMTGRGVDGEDSWIRYEYWNADVHVTSDTFFYTCPTGFFTLRVGANGMLVLDAVGCINIASIASPGVFTHVPGEWESKMFAR
jgi:hypothetical protein